QRREALRAPRRAHRPRDLVARDELAALDLRSGDVDVALGLLGRREPQEARAVAEQLDGPLDDALVIGSGSRSGSGRGSRDRLRAVDELARVPVTRAPAAPAAAPAPRALGLLAGGISLGLSNGLAALAREDGIDQVGLAQPAEAVDPELV